MEGGEPIGTVLSILLLILKILGITLLVILGLVILILVLVLCVPIRYDLKGRYRDDGLKAKGGIHWLLKLVHVKLAAINAQILVKVNVLGRCFKKMHIGKWDEEPEASEEGGAPKTEAEPEKKPEQKDKKENAPAQPYDAVFAGMEEAEEKEKKERKAEKKKEAAADPAAGESEEGTDIRELIRKAEVFLDDEKNQYTIHLILKQLLRMGKHLLPTRFLVEGRLGLGDPAKTGELVGKVYRFYPLYGDHIRLDGVYDEEVKDIYAEIGGRIRLGVFVEIAVRLLLNKNFRSWLKQMKKDKNEKNDKNGQPAEQPEAAAA